jgi:hypothetical protein
MSKLRIIAALVLITISLLGFGVSCLVDSSTAGSLSKSGFELP